MREELRTIYGELLHAESVLRAQQEKLVEGLRVLDNLKERVVSLERQIVAASVPPGQAAVSVPAPVEFRGRAG